MIPPIARHGRLPRSRPWATVLRFVATTLAVVLVSAGAVAGYAVYDVAKSVRPGVKLIGQTDGPPPNISSFTGGINVLVAASDSGGGDVGTYGKRGEHLNGLTIPFAALTEFQGVVGLSNAVGGVTVCIAKAIHDEQISFDLAAGQQTLVGQQAVQFLRVRYGVGDGSDLARISNQQLFLSALVRKIKTPETLGNPIKAYALAKAVIGNTTRSDSLNSVTTLVSMALAVKDISFDKVVFVQYPGSYGSAAGQNGVLPIRSAADILFTALKNDRPVSLTGKTGDGTSTDPTATVAPAPSGTASGAPVVKLPSNATGQTAAQATCTKGQRAKG